MSHKKINKIIAGFLVVLINSFLFVPYTYAATLTNISDTLTRLKAAEVADHTINFTTSSGIQAADTVVITFPAGSFSMGASPTVTIADNGGTAGAPASAAWSTPVLTITADADSTVAAGHTATITIASVTNPAIGTYLAAITGTFGDTGSFATAIITEDQIAVTASIDPTLTFTVATTTLALGTLTSGSVSTAGPNTITIASNSSRGYSITIRDAGSGSAAGLYNSVSAKLIPSATAAVSAGTENYGGTCDVSGSPTGTCSFPTNASGNVNKLGGVTYGTSATFASLAAGSKPTSGGDSYSLRVRAAIATTTDSGSYADTLTVIGTMNF